MPSTSLAQTRLAEEDVAPARVPQRLSLEPCVSPQASVRVLRGRAADAPRDQMVSRRLCTQDARARRGSQASAWHALPLRNGCAGRRVLASCRVCRWPDARTPLPLAGRGQAPSPRRQFPSSPSAISAGVTDREPGAPAARDGAARDVLQRGRRARRRVQ